MAKLPWTYNDGGCADAGYKPSGDCVIRAIAVASRRPYQEILEMVINLSQFERRSKRKRGISSRKTGVYGRTARKVMEQLGAKWVPIMGIGTGCKVHLAEGELPNGRLVCSVSRHYVAVIDGVIQDTSDPSRGGTRCVYAYAVFP